MTQVKAPKVNREIQIDLGIPDSLGDLVAKFGDDAVAKAAKAAFVVSAQGYVRSMLVAGVADNEIIAKAREWKPGTREARGKGDILARIGSMSAEERAEVIKYLQELAAKAKAEPAKK